MSIQQILENAGVENAEVLAQSLEEHIQTRLDDLEMKYEHQLVESISSASELSEETLDEQLVEHKEKLQEWHQSVLEQELAQVDNQLKVAADIRKVRAGLEKIVEGLQQCGVSTTQLYETTLTAELALVNDQVSVLQEELMIANDEAQAYNRAFIVSEATKGLTMMERDEVIKSADSINECYDINQFREIIESVAAVKSYRPSHTEIENLEEAYKAKSPSLNESTRAYNAPRFVAAPQVSSDISRYFS